MVKARKKKKKLSDVGRMLEQHKTYCAVHVYSGDRHCSCGRDNAILTMRGAQLVLGKELFKKLFGEVFDDNPAS